MTIEAEFNIGCEVFIEALNRKGRVQAIYISELGLTYSVRYFDNAEAKTIYFYPDELMSAKLIPEKPNPLQP